MNDSKPGYAFFITEGLNDKGQRYESCVSDNQTDDQFLRDLLEEFLKARQRGHARIMISNREKEDWQEDWSFGRDR